MRMHIGCKVVFDISCKLILATELIMNGFCSKRIFGTSLTVPSSMDMTFLLFVKNGLEEILLESHTGTTLFILNLKKISIILVSCKAMQNRYEDDEILGHRLYREIRRVEQVKKEPGKRSRGKGGSSAISVVSYQWETVASTFDEFDDVAVSFDFCVPHICSQVNYLVLFVLT